MPLSYEEWLSMLTDDERANQARVMAWEAAQQQRREQRLKERAERIAQHNRQMEKDKREKPPRKKPEIEHATAAAGYAYFGNHRERRSRVNWFDLLPESYACRQIIWERYQTVRAMKRAGLTFREIGERFGFSSGRARQMHERALRFGASPAEQYQAMVGIGDTWPIEKYRQAPALFSSRVLQLGVARYVATPVR